MGQNDSQIIELDIKDILGFVLKKVHIIFIVGLLFALMAGGYSYAKSYKSVENAITNSSVLDIENRLSGESDLEYNQRVQLVNRALTIVSTIDSLNNQSDNLRNYLTHSLVMQLDPMNVSVSEAQLIIELDDGESVGMDDALISSYTNASLTGSFLLGVSNEYGYETSALQELIRVSNNKYNDETVFNNDTLTAIVLKITVWGESEELTEALLDGALAEINGRYNEYNSTIARHTIYETGRQHYISFVEDIRTLQMDTITTYQGIQGQIDSGNIALDDIAKQLGLSDRNSFYADYSDNVSVSKAGVSKKHIAIGFILGAMLTICAYVCIYIWGRKIYSQTQFFCLFPSCKSIGILKPQGKRNRYIAFIDRINCDDSDLDADKTTALVVANYKNISQGRGKILITGTVVDDTVQSIAKIINITGDIKADIINNPDILESLSDYDGVVIIEQRGVSEKKKIKKELELIDNASKPIIGAIII